MFTVSIYTLYRSTVIKQAMTKVRTVRRLRSSANSQCNMSSLSCISHQLHHFPMRLANNAASIDICDFITSSQMAICIGSTARNNMSYWHLQSNTSHTTINLNVGQRNKSSCELWQTLVTTDAFSWPVSNVGTVPSSCKPSTCSLSEFSSILLNIHRWLMKLYC